ncbi:hypothetical protein MMC27_005110 [Xylographa pallens]|nr:hypothetical protein [Xylographa pallens]
MDPFASSAGHRAPIYSEGKSYSTTQLPPSKHASVEAWILDTVHLDTRSEPVTSRKRKFNFEGDTECHSASKRLKHPAHVRISLTRAALHRNNCICAGRESLPPSPIPDDSSPESCATHSMMASSKGSKAKSDLMVELGLRMVYLAPDDISPDNWQEICDIINRPRTSPEPDSEKLKDIYNSFKTAGNEADARATALAGLVRECWYRGKNNGIVKQQLDQQWIRCVHLCPSVKTNLMKDPKPDQALGWTMVALGSLEAIVKLRFHPPKEERGDTTEAEGWKSWAAPNEQIYFPVFTTEGKGAKGDLTVAMRQNLWNGAIMVNNLLKLKRETGQEDSFLRRAMVFSLECTDQLAQLNCHWAAKDPKGIVCYWAKDIFNWTLRDRRMEQYKEARRCIANAVEYYMDKAFTEISADLQKLAEMSMSSRQAAASSSTQAESEVQPVATHKRTHSKVTSDGEA